MNPIRISHNRFSLYCSCALLFNFFLVGCGGKPDQGPTGTVSGTVTLNGQPLKGATIRFTADQKTPFGAELNEAGNFTIANPVLTGSYKVTVHPPAIGPSIGSDGQMQPADPEAMKLSEVPAKYQSEQSTDLTQTVNEGENTFTIDLKP